MNILNVKIRNVIFLSISLILFLLLIMLLVSGRIIYNINRNKNTEYFKVSSVALENSIKNYVDEIDTIASSIANSRYIYQFSITEDSNERYSSYKNILDSVNTIEKVNYYASDLFYYNSDTLYIGDSNSQYYSEIRTLIANLELSDSINSLLIKKIYDEYSDFNDYIYIALKKSYFDKMSNSQIYAVLILNENKINSIVNSILDDSSLVIILDSSKNIMTKIGKMPDNESNEIERMLLRNEPDDVYFKNSKNLLYVNKSIELVDWQIVFVTDISRVDDFSMKSIFIICIIVISMIFLLLLFYAFTNRFIISPILGITEFVKTLGSDFSNSKYKINFNNEIGSLANGINKMLDNINDLQNEMITVQRNAYLTQLSNNQAKLEALQSQINPHFLYNTLDCIRGMALAKNIKSIANVSSSLSKMMRYSIKANDHVMISDEIKCVENYMIIINSRHDNRFHTQYDVESKLLKNFVPKMILQPIVENAVFHGLEPKNGEGNIWIKISKKHDGIQFIIEDDGIGIDNSVLNQLRYKLKSSEYTHDNIESNIGIGILNIKQRLELISNGNSSFDIFSTVGKGTRIEMFLSILS